MLHTNFSRVNWVIFVEVDPVVMHVTSIPLAFWVLLVFAEVPWPWLTRLQLTWPQSFQLFLSLDGMCIAQKKEQSHI